LGTQPVENPADKVSNQKSVQSVQN
jgi:hypothetical protein